MFSFTNNNLIPTISDKFRRNDTNLVYLFTNARDEPNIAEWVAHHINLGFDKIYVFDHLSIEPISSKIKTDFDGKLNLIQTKGSGNIKLNLMRDAVNISKKNNVSWMLYLDADEFLCLNNHTNIKDYLKHFSHADSIGINWLMFGNSGHINQPKGLLTENFTRSELKLHKHVKSFVRPSSVKNIFNPHFYNIINNSRCYNGNGTKMIMGPFNPQPLPFMNSAAYIAHYYIQSEEEYIRRKGRNMDDGNGTKLGLDVNIMYNNISNNEVKNKYSQTIKDCLNLYDVSL
jgi:hypothetical protein